MSEHSDHNHTTTTTRTSSEIAGVLTVLIGLLLGISLVTYNPQDPSFSTATTSTTIENAIGKGGALAADLCFQILGISAYFVPLFLIRQGIRFLKTHPSPYVFRSLFGGGLLMVTLLTFAELISDSTTPLNLRGGVLGVFAGQVLNDYWGRIGTYLLLAFFALLGLMLVFTFSLSHVIHTLLAPFGHLVEGMKQHVGGALKKNTTHTDDPHSAPALHKVTHPAPPHHDPHPDDDHDESHDMEAFDDPEAFDAYDEDAAVSWGNTASDGADGESPGYQLPPLSLLEDPPPQVVRGSNEELAAQSKILKRKLMDFGVNGEVREIHPGPVVTLFEFEPAPGIKLNRITTLADDLALAMRAPQVRIVPRIPGKAVVGIEIPNRVREGIFLKEILVSSAFTRLSSKVRVALGKDISGAPMIADLAGMPHLLIAGATGSGKSVGLNNILLSILFSASPQEVKLLLIDPKMLELSLYEDIPHLFAPVITRPQAAAGALKKMVEEMQRRYERLAERGVRNIEAYNKLCASEALQTTEPKNGGEDAPHGDTTHPLVPLPYIVVVIDELADLMVVASRDVEESIGRLAQMARAAGIHLVLATQRPSVDVITGVIKANFTARIAYAVTSKIDSRTILDTNGADQLLGKGDMLYLSSGTSKLQRIHGPYVSEEEVKRVVSYIKGQGAPAYQEGFSEGLAMSKEADSESRNDLRDGMYDQACELVVTTGQASASFIQRRLRVGYPRAARMIEMMEEDGLVGPAVGSKPREIRKDR